MTVSDRRIVDRVEKFQRPGVDIRVSRLIAINPQDVPDPDVAAGAG
jgi:hypothetical protein